MLIVLGALLLVQNITNLFLGFLVQFAHLFAFLAVDFAHFLLLLLAEVQLLGHSLNVAVGAFFHRRTGEGRGGEQGQRDNHQFFHRLAP